MGIGGMNHFMLPEEGDYSSMAWGSDPTLRMTRYGNWAIEFLINELIKIGADRTRFEVKVFGGGQVVANMSDVGQRNILFTFDYLQKEGLVSLATNVGDVYPRKVIYFPETGRVLMKKLKSKHNETVVRRDKAYLERINQEETKSTDIELF
jgi:chemotaxis protein CheD